MTGWQGRRHPGQRRSFSGSDESRRPGHVGLSTDLQQRIEDQKLQLQLAQLERDTAKLQLETAQDLAAAAETRQRSPQGSTRSELSSGASYNSDPVDEQPIRARSAHRQRDSSIRQSTTSTLAWQQAEGKRQHKVGAAMTNFRNFSGSASDEPIGLWNSDCIVELQEKLVPQEFWAREMATRLSGPAKSHVRSQLEDWRSTSAGRATIDDYPSLVLVVSWLRTRVVEPWSAYLHVRAVDTFTRPPGSFVEMYRYI